MMMSIYAGLSGLKAQQQKLDVIGNNIANVNTVGFKQQTVSFSDLLSQTLNGATSPNAATNQGGINPQQIGLGVDVASTAMMMTNGSTQSTGNPNDLAISGAGFFIVQGSQAGSYEFTRAGNFGVDENGNLTVGGMEVCGWQQYTQGADGSDTFNTQKAVEPINFFADAYNGNKKIIAPQATSSASLTGNLDPSKTAIGSALNTIATPVTNPDETTTMKVYDALGNGYDVQVNFTKCYVDTTNPASPVTSWYWQASSSSANLGVSGSGFIEFDANGNIIKTDPTNFNFNPQITLTPSAGVGTAPFNMNLDLTGVSTFAGSNSNDVTASKINGYAAGDLQDFNIGADGVITGVYSNGQKQPLGMVALTTFANPEGMEKVGSNLYATTPNSGDFTGGVQAGTAGTGQLSSGTLEMSNVDLAEQFSEMMITQRAYQANTKIISTADTCLDTVINMVR